MAGETAHIEDHHGKNKKQKRNVSSGAKYRFMKKSKVLYVDLRIE